MKNFISPCNHPESYLSGSTIESMIDKTQELGIPYFACTDNNSLTGILKGYNYCKKSKNIGVKFIPGIELYFKDPKDPFKYSKIILHAQDQKAYQALVKMTSERRKTTARIAGEYHVLFGWEDLKSLSQYNIMACTSNVECMVSKYLLIDQEDEAEKILKNLMEIFPNKLYLSIVPISQEKYWSSVVKANLGGVSVDLPALSIVETDRYQNSQAFEIGKKYSRHKKVKAININGVRFKIKPEHQDIVSASIENEFQPMLDVQTRANKFILSMAKKYNMEDKLLLNSYSYYANKGDKVVQDMKLGEDKRVYQSQYIMSTEDAIPYLKEKLDLSENTISLIVENSYMWVDKFKSLKMDYNYRLPEPEGNPEQLLMKRIKEMGRMNWEDPRYKEQLKEEFNLLTKNGVLNLIPYFLPITDIYDYYSKNGYLTGPARGSAGGFLISYLIGITHVDPIKYGLSSSRFLTLDRVQSGNLPDIDCDLESRVPLVGKDGNGGYLFKKYGKKAAQVSTRTLLRIKSAILDANRFVNNGKVEDSIAALSKSLPNTPQGVSDQKFVFGYEEDGNHIPGLLETNKDLKRYSEERPEEWNIVSRALSLSRQHSRHACFAGDTLVNEYGKVTKIKNSPKYAKNKPITTWSNGIKDTVIVSFNNGVSIQCTPDHRFMVGPKEVEAKDLVGEIVSYEPFVIDPQGKHYDMDFAFALGWFLNDGAYISSVERFEFYFTPEKDDEPKNRIIKWLTRKGFKATMAKDRPDTYRSYSLPDEFKQMPQKTPDKRLPDFFWEMDALSQIHFMKGLFSANGYCLNTRPTVGIKLTSKLLISDIAIWLNAFNIETSCSFSKPQAIEHHNGKYVSKSTATLTIPHSSNKSIFRDKIGFEQTYKSKRLNEIIDCSINTSYQRGPVKCLSIEKSESLEVFDFNEPLENVGFINGILVHNCAFIISDQDIEDTVPIMEVGGVERVTQPEHKDCEAAGLIKYDFLVVSALKDIKLCLNYINKRNKTTDFTTGYFLHNDKKTYIWDLPEDPEVFDMLSRGETETVFQLHTAGATPTVMKVQPKSIIDCATITSLERPGPKDFRDPKTGRNMVEEYIERKFGRSKGDIPILDQMLPETYGVLVFQEQITKLATELAGLGVEDSENVRIAVGKKKEDLIMSLKPIFIDGASKKVDRETATKIWDMMETFARYGFNKSHAVAYSVISYACAFLKYHYKLEWWAAVITNATDKEINEVFYKYIKDMVLPPDVNVSTEQIEIDYDLNKIRAKLSIIAGLGKKTAESIVDNRPYESLYQFVQKGVCGPALARKLIYIGALDSLFDPRDEDLTKISKYEEMVARIQYEQKLQEYGQKIEEANEEEAQKIEKRMLRYKEKGPKATSIPDEYIGINSKKAFQIKKSVFPTINLDLISALKESSSFPIIEMAKGRYLITNNGEMRLFSGEHLHKLDDMDVNQEVSMCVPGYILDASEFPYQGGSRKALKLIIDSSGYVSEKVIWPDYETGELLYDPELKKGAIVYFLYNKKPGKPYTNIKKAIIEEKSILS